MSSGSSCRGAVSKLPCLGWPLLHGGIISMPWRCSSLHCSDLSHLCRSHTMVFKVFRNIPLPGRMRHPVHNKSLKQRMRDEVPEGAEQFHVAWVRNAPHARICVLQMEAVADGEAVLGGFKGVLATQVGSSIGSPQTVRVCEGRSPQWDFQLQGGRKGHMLTIA